MIKPKEKNCKGTGNAKGCGCGEPTYNRTFGLCLNCLRIWSVTMEEGKAWLKKQTMYKMKSNKKEEKAKNRQEKKDIDEKGAMRLADMYFSRFIRVLFSEDGNCTCYTCGGLREIKEVDNGHYQKREHKATRYHLNNCRPQCKTCNGDVKHNGKQDEFRVNLVCEIGEEAVVEIERLARTMIKANVVFYRDIADEFRNKLNELQKKLKVKYW